MREVAFVIVIAVLGFGYLSWLNERDNRAIELTQVCRTDAGRDAWIECVRNASK